MDKSKRNYRPPLWSAEVVGRMHLYGITTARLAQRLGVQRTYVSEVLTGRRGVKNAEARFKAALDELIAGDSLDPADDKMQDN